MSDLLEECSDWDYGFAIEDDHCVITWPDPEGTLCDCCGDVMQQLIALPRDKMLDLYLMLRNYYEE